MAIRSHDLAHAWLVAAPLSIDAFERAPSLVELARTHAGLDRETLSLWKLTESSLRPRLDGVSLVTLEHLRDRAWFSEPAPDSLAQRTSLANYLVRVAREWLHHDGSGPVLAEDHRLDTPAHVLVARWRCMSLLLPADLLVAAVCAGADHEKTPLDDQPLLPSRLLLRLLRDDPAHGIAGVAETHIHGNAALTFADLWSNWLRGVGRAPSRKSADERGLPFESWSRLRAMSLCAALARSAMQRFLLLPDGAKTLGFDRWFFGDADGSAFSKDVDALPDWAVEDVWREAFESLRTARHCEDEDVIDRRVRVWRSLEARDPTARSRVATRASNETVLTQRALRYLRRREDPGFATLFWQYVRLRVALFRSITLEPGTPGLDWFDRTDRRVALFRHEQFYDERIQQGLANTSAGVALRAYEPRFVPDSTERALLGSLRNMLEGALAARRDSRARVEWSRWEFGVVFHFAKHDRSARCPLDEGDLSPMLADPEHGDGLAFNEWILDNTRRAEALCAVLDAFPEALLLVRGTDVAGRELSMPTWPVVSMLRAVRAASCRAAYRARERWPALGLEEIRCTFHTGEDYRHLTEGLRRIHEVIEAGLLRRGDRLGHAIALGDSPERWRRSLREIVTTRLDRLNDLLWELDRYADGSFRPPSGRVERAEEQAREQIARLFARRSLSDIDLRAHRIARRALLDPSVQRELGYSLVREEHPRPATAPDELTDSVWQALRCYTQDRLLFERSNEPVTVRCDDAELEMAAAAQRWLRSIVTELEITVEANPSSNLLIADYARIDEHPVFRLLPLQSQRADTPVLVSLNSDDPIVFATRASDEYAYIFNALRRENVSAPEAIEWLDRVRENAIRSRFTLRASCDDDALQWLLTRLTVGETALTEQLEQRWARGDHRWRDAAE